jgi:hypothetical protein
MEPDRQPRPLRLHILQGYRLLTRQSVGIGAPSPILYYMLYRVLLTLPYTTVQDAPSPTLYYYTECS